MKRYVFGFVILLLTILIVLLNRLGPWLKYVELEINEIGFYCCSFRLDDLSKVTQRYSVTGVIPL